MLSHDVRCLGRDLLRERARCLASVLLIRSGLREAIVMGPRCCPTMYGVRIGTSRKEVSGASGRALLVSTELGKLLSTNQAIMWHHSGDRVVLFGAW